MIEEIKIETITDILNACKKHPNQIDVLVKDVKNFIKENLFLEKTFNKHLKNDDNFKGTRLPSFFVWVPDGKNWVETTIILKEETKNADN